MENSRKVKLVNYLYPNKLIIDFMFNDFYIELLNVLPKSVCFSVKNIFCNCWRYISRIRFIFNTAYKQK